MLFVKLIQFLPLPCKKFVAYMCTCKVIVNKKFPIVIFTHTHTHTHSHTHTNVLLINSWNDLRRHGWVIGYARCLKINI